jgi:hypothetical protein
VKEERERRGWLKGMKKEEGERTFRRDVMEEKRKVKGKEGR